MICTCDGELIFTATGHELEMLNTKLQLLATRWDRDGKELRDQADREWNEYLGWSKIPATYEDPLPEALKQFHALPWWTRLFTKKPTPQSHPMTPIKEPRRYPSSACHSIRGFSSMLKILQAELAMLDFSTATYVCKGGLNSDKMLPHRILNVNMSLELPAILKNLGVDVRAAGTIDMYSSAPHVGEWICN